MPQKKICEMMDKHYMHKNTNSIRCFAGKTYQA